MSEIDAVLPLCRLIAKVWRQNNGRALMPSGKWVTFGVAGVPDYIGFMKDGRFLAIEAKRLDEQLTTEQRQFLDLLNASGGLGFVAFCAEDVLSRLR